MLFHVVVEAWDEAGSGEYYDSIVLAHSERSARTLATRAVARLRLAGAHSVEITPLDVRTTGTVFITNRNEEAYPRFKRGVAGD